MVFLKVAGLLLVGFFAYLTSMVFEFIVSPTHGYITFCKYGSNVCIKIFSQQFIALFKDTATMHNYCCACHNVFCFVAASLFTFFISICPMSNFDLTVSKNKNKYVKSVVKVSKCYKKGLLKSIKSLFFRALLPHQTYATLVWVAQESFLFSFIGQNKVKVLSYQVLHSKTYFLLNLKIFWLQNIKFFF